LFIVELPSLELVVTELMVLPPEATAVAVIRKAAGATYVLPVAGPVMLTVGARGVDGDGKPAWWWSKRPYCRWP